MKANEFVKRFGINKVKGITFVMTSGTVNYDGISVDYDDLKRLVESHELVEKFGGLDKAKKVAKNAFDSYSKIISDRSIGLECTYMNLMNAIADVESCQ